MVQPNPLNVGCEAVVARWQGVRSAYRQSLSNLSRIVHPWRLVDATRQTSQEVERQLHVEIQVLETLLETHGLPVKKDTLNKVRKQLAGVSALIDFWWQTVWHDLEHMTMTPRWTQWVEELLLPLIVLAKTTVTHALSSSKSPDRLRAPGGSRRV